MYFAHSSENCKVKLLHVMRLLETLLESLPLQNAYVQKLHDSIGLFKICNNGHKLILRPKYNPDSAYLKLAYSLVMYRGCIDQDLDPWLLLYRIQFEAERVSIISAIAACFDTYWSLYVHDQMTQEFHKSNEENRSLKKRIEQLETDLRQADYTRHYENTDFLKRIEALERHSRRKF
jgi:hypothetical protein